LPTFKEVHPVLPVRDIKKAVAYYQDRLGFRLKFQDNPDEPKYAGVSRGSVELHLQWHDEKDFNKVERLALRFVIDDIDSLFIEYKDKDVFHSGTKLQNTSWGTREFAFYDLNGNGLFFYRDLN
jgi:catechol 2,3-dioxygenase-like lactoylglutathione lyase family enzyme